MLTPTKVETWNGLKVNIYMINTAAHNVNRIDMPSGTISKPIGVTIHNTAAISVALTTTMAEQYTRATINGNMKDVRVHFYVDEYCAWQNLPLTSTSWHAGDGNGDGNTKTISIEIIGNSAKAEANGVKLAAYLLNKFNLPIDRLYKHQDWNGKYCPAYIIPHWSAFKGNVLESLNSLKKTNGTSTTPVTELYRIRKTWEDSKSQIGAYANLQNAINSCKDGYSVFNNKGEKVYPKETAKPSAPQEVKPSQSAQTTVSKPDVIYRVLANSKWNGEIKNYNNDNSMGYAGIEGCAVKGLVAKSTAGTLSYRVHLKNNGWLGWINQYNINDMKNGYAGIWNMEIDGIQAKLDNAPGYEVRYRVSNVNSKDYYPWVLGIEDYAGVYGKTIDKIQMEIVKV